jgi:transposase
MNRVNVEIEVELPDGVHMRGYERFEGGHAFEVDWDLPERCECSKCHQEAPIQLRYKNEVLAIRDLDILGLPSFFVYQPPMHQCPQCRQRTQLTPPFKRPFVTYTYRFEELVLDLLVGSSAEEVAGRLGIAAETVEKIVEYRLAAEREIPADQVITSIGLDELSLKKRHKLYVTVMSDLSDPEHPRVLVVAKGRDTAATDACLARLSPEQRAAVRSHRTDMSAVYPEVCSRWLPNSQLVLDRFHVAKHLGGLVDGLRKKHVAIS